MKKKDEKQYRKELLSVLRDAAKSADALDAFLEDILTPREYQDIARRLQIVKQLQEGKPHREIAENLGVGVATVLRGARELQDPSGGFNKMNNWWHAPQKFKERVLR